MAEKIDFLYKQQKADPEAFLLGQKIDKSQHLNTYTSEDAATANLGGVEGLQRQSVRAELQQQASGATMSAEEIEAQRVSIDMQAKMRDDPLFMIRKREEDDKREMLRNPLKRRRLQQMVRLVKNRNESTAQSIVNAVNEDDDGNNLLTQYLDILRQKNAEKAQKASALISGKEVKNDKRGRQHSRSQSRSRSVSSSSSTSSADSLLEGYMNALQQKQSLIKKMHDEEKLAEIKARKAKQQEVMHPGQRDDNEDDGNKRSRSSSPVRRSFHSRKTSNSRRTSDDSKQGNRRDRYNYPDRNRRRSRSDSRSPRHHSRPSRDTRRRSRSRDRHRHRSRSPKARSPQRTSLAKPGKLSPGSKARRLKEMLEAGEERNTERASNVKRYKEEERQELAAETEVRQKAKASFLRGTMLDHADRSSLGDRVQRNKFNMQRRRDDVISGGERFLKR